MKEEEKDEFREEEMDIVKYERVNTLHAKIHIPRRSRTNDIIYINHDGAEKKLHVPKGVQGQDITVKMVSSRKIEQEPETGAFCGCF